MLIFLNKCLLKWYLSFSLKNTMFYSWLVNPFEYCFFLGGGTVVDARIFLSLLYFMFIFFDWVFRYFLFLSCSILKCCYTIIFSKKKKNWKKPQTLFILSMESIWVRATEKNNDPYSSQSLSTPPIMTLVSDLGVSRSSQTCGQTFCVPFGG